MVNSCVESNSTPEFLKGSAPGYNSRDVQTNCGLKSVLRPELQLTKPRSRWTGRGRRRCFRPWRRWWPSAAAASSRRGSDQLRGVRDASTPTIPTTTTTMSRLKKRTKSKKVLTIASDRRWHIPLTAEWLLASTDALRVGASSLNALVVRKAKNRATGVKLDGSNCVVNSSKGGQFGCWSTG